MNLPSNETIFGFPKYPPFKLNEPRFPSDSFIGRYLHYLDVVDPRTLFMPQNKVDECLRLLNEFSTNPNKFGPEQNAQLWRAQKVKQAIFHPDTGEKVFPAFRMSGFVPFGWITVAGMLLPNPSWPTLIFWQWANQTHNACVNYANRNATKQQPFQVYAKAYFAAVSAALGVSASLTWFIKQASNWSPTKKMIVQRFVPVPATSLASTLNMLFMRGSELDTGIDVFDASGNRVGTSKVAAREALTETAITRAFLPIPLLIVPACVMPALERLKFVQKTPLRHLVVNSIVCTLSFAIFLPIALALFPQQRKIQRDRLEEEIQKHTTENFLFYNRGL